MKHFFVHSQKNMNKNSPYWILNPLENNITIRSYKNWSFYTSEEVISGNLTLALT